MSLRASSSGMTYAALAIDGNLAQAHISLAYASFTYDWDWPAATRHFDQAFAIVHVGLGENDHALSWLDKAYEERFNRLAYLRREPVWDPLRSDPRFTDLLRRINLPQ